MIRWEKHYNIITIPPREGEYQFVNPMPKVMQQVFPTHQTQSENASMFLNVLEVDMRAMKEVNINWKMLTNLRPDNKADEIFFAQ